jgi:class 3 adenylate cyclase/tetratricopeptide (TPR) repeat protein
MVYAAGRHPAAGRTASAWRSYVPDFVVQALLAHPGETPIANAELIHAVVVFADIVGFTPLSEALAREGSYGTEELTRILNSWLGSMADRISCYDGSVAEFAGDALVAMFRYDSRDRRSRRATVLRVIHCALEMQADMAQFHAISTHRGTFGLAMKAGIGDGRLLPTIMGDPAGRLVSVLAGPALDRAAMAERQARSDEVVVGAELVRERIGIEVKAWRGDWCVVSPLRRPAAPVPATAPGEPSELDQATVERLVPFFHPAIAERLSSGRRDLVNEHRIVTVAFIRLAELVADVPQSVLALQQSLVAASHVIAEYGGHLHQVATGDKGTVLIVYFGAPVSHEDDEERAVSCCVDLLRLPGGPFRAGIATGLVYAGEAGTDNRRSYTVIGDSANLAARLMQAAKAGQLLVDGATHERIEEAAVGERLEPVTVKGKAGSIVVWLVRAVRERTGARSRGGGSAPRLLGRHQELTRLTALMQRACAGNGQVVCITGEVGIGKSRLGAEASQIAQNMGFAGYGGACRSYGTKISYLVWRSIWRDILGLDQSLPLGEQQADLKAKLARRIPGSVAKAPLLAPVVNVPMPDSELTAGLDPQRRDELLRSLLLDCLRERAASGPLLLTLEDGHWIDPASQVLLEFLARNLADAPVVVMVMARTETRSPLLAVLSQVGWFTEVQLAELAGADAELLVGNRLRERYGADASFAHNVVRQLAERGEGNPFYLEELVSYLHGRGVDPSHGGALAGLDLPPGLQRLMTARLDQLSEGAKATIKVASVIGRRFRARWIAEIYPAAGTPEEVAGHLEHLAELDLTPTYAADPGGEFAFKHAITQESAYASLTFELRETLHERVGELMETCYADRLAQYVDILAHHYGRTRRVDKQRVWYRAAGDAAKAAFANEAAVGYYERLLLLLPAPESGAVLAELGEVWQLTGQWRQAEDAYRRAMDVASRSGDRALLATAQRCLGNLFMYQGHRVEAADWLSSAAEEFGRLGDQQGLSSALNRLTYSLIRQRAYAEARATAERHLAVAREAGDLAGTSVALNHLGLVSSSTGDAASAVALHERAFEVARNAGDQPCLIDAAHNLALVHYRQRDHQRAAGYWQEALAVAQRIGRRQSVAHAIGNLGEVFRDQGDYADAIRCFCLAFQIVAELGEWREVANQAASLAVAAAAEGRDQAAERLFAKVAELAGLLDDPYLICYSLHYQAQLYADRGRFQEAAQRNEEALELASQHGAHDIRVSAEMLSIRLNVALGRVRRDAAVGRLEELLAEWIQPHERAAILDLRDELDPAPEARREAAALYRRLYERAPTVEYRKRYARLTGTELPPGPPLPPLPEIAQGEVVDFDVVLRQVDLAARLLGGG